MKFVTIVGARPQFIKHAALARRLRREHTEVLVHTGQHYDHGMSKIFFEELDLPEPEVNLGVGSGPHGRQTGRMLAGLEEVLFEERPDRVVVYGDTNSTLAGALAAAKLGLPLAHVEAGLRSFQMGMPEEINRVVADRLADSLLCPSDTAVSNLRREGITRGVTVVGDVMADVLAGAVRRARDQSRILERLGFQEKKYLLATVHRAENTDHPGRLAGILEALNGLGEAVVFPVHPRTRAALAALEWSPGPRVSLIDPVGYLDMVRLEQAARMVLTDSGGVQKEAYWLGVPCVTLRLETEWVETVESGWNRLAGAETARILEAAAGFVPPAARPALYGDGAAAARCLQAWTAAG